MIIGITGTNGSGKNTVVDYLIAKKGFHHYSVRQFLTKLLEQKGLHPDRMAMRGLANEIRSTHDPAYIIRHLHELSLREGAQYAVIESVRNVGEAEYLLSHGVFLLAVDADRLVRFNRIQSRKSATDHVDLSTFIAHEELEMNPEGSHDMDIRGVMSRAHTTLANNNSVAALEHAVDAVLATWQRLP
jgi:dephospho-CoA kinase